MASRSTANSNAFAFTASVVASNYTSKILYLDAFFGAAFFDAAVVATLGASSLCRCELNLKLGRCISLICRLGC